MSVYETHLRFRKEELENKVVLDLGAGPEAKFAKQLKESGIEANVISLSPDFSEKKYRRNVQGSFPEGTHISATGQSLPLKNESCDRIFAFHIFEHLSGEDLLKCISEMARVLKLKGKATLGPIPDIPGIFLPNIEALMGNENLKKELADSGIDITKEKIPEDVFLIPTMKIYSSDGDAFGERLHDVPGYNLVLTKIGK